MWKNINGRLIQVTDDARVKFRTNISRSILNQLSEVAEEYNTHVNYLLETGLEALLAEGTIVYNKDARPKDRIQYKTTYDKGLLVAVREFAAEKGLYVNDVIEYSAGLIDVAKSKDKSYKSRIERAGLERL